MKKEKWKSLRKKKGKNQENQQRLKDNIAKRKQELDKKKRR